MTRRPHSAERCLHGLAVVKGLWQSMMRAAELRAVRRSSGSPGAVRDQQHRGGSEAVAL